MIHETQFEWSKYRLWLSRAAMDYGLAVTWLVGIFSVFRSHWQSPCTALTTGKCLPLRLCKVTVKESTKPGCTYWQTSTRQLSSLFQRNRRLSEYRLCTWKHPRTTLWCNVIFVSYMWQWQCITSVQHKIDTFGVYIQISWSHGLDYSYPIAFFTLHQPVTQRRGFMIRSLYNKH